MRPSSAARNRPLTLAGRGVSNAWDASAASLRPAFFPLGFVQLRQQRKHRRRERGRRVSSRSFFSFLRPSSWELAFMTHAFCTAPYSQRGAGRNVSSPNDFLCAARCRALSFGQPESLSAFSYRRLQRPMRLSETTHKPPSSSTDTPRTSSRCAWQRPSLCPFSRTTTEAP